MATRSSFKERELRNNRLAAEGTYARGKAAERQATVAEKESFSKRLGNYGNAISGAVKGIGSAAGVMAALNDPKWYKKLGVTDQTARLPSNIGPGSYLSGYFFGSRFGQTPSYTIPSVCSIKWMPMIGIAQGEAEDPANATAAYLMAQLRKGNSRSGTDYDPSDLLMLQFFGWAMDAALEDIRFCIGAVHKYSHTHKLLAQALVEGKGYDYDQFRNYRSQIISKFNAVIERLNYLPILAGPSIRERWKFLSSLCIRDARTEHGSYYMFHFPCYPVWTPEQNKLEFTKHNEYPLTVLDTLLQVATAVSDSADMVIMISDMRGGFRDSDFYHFEYVFEEYSIQLQESREVIDQIHNLNLLPLCDGYQVNNGSASYNVIGMPKDTCPFNAAHLSLDFTITQNTDGYLRQGTVAPYQYNGTVIQKFYGIVCALAYDADGNPTRGMYAGNPVYNSENLYLDFDKDDITVDDILVASRLTSFWKSETITYYNGSANQQAHVYTLEQCGSELCLNMSVACISMTTGLVTWTCMWGGTISSNIGATTNLGDAVRANLGYHNLLHWSPKLYVLGDQCVSTTVIQLLWDMGRLVPYKLENARLIDYQCLMSELNVPESDFKFVR